VARTLAQFVTALYWVYLLLIFLYILFSWVQLPYNIWLGRLREFLSDTVEPYLRLFRRVLPPVGGFDFTPIIAIIVLTLAEQIVVSVLQQFY
jgi:YggT family protein